MSVQIKISYQDDAELSAIVEALAPMGLKLEVAEQKGNYQRAYLKTPATYGMRYRTNVNLCEGMQQGRKTKTPI